MYSRTYRIDEGSMIKVSDFGLSLDVYEKNYFRLDADNDTKLPIKWMALESMIDRVFSEKTDVVSKIFTSNYNMTQINLSVEFRTVIYVFLLLVVFWCHVLGNI